MTFAVVNLGCKVNRVESDSFASHLLAQGCSQSVDNPRVVIVNTCTVTGEAQAKTRKAVRRQIKDHPDACIIVTGCAAVINAQEFKDMGEQVHVVSKNDVVSYALTTLGKNRIDVDDSEGLLRIGSSFPTRVGLKVQDGCNNACTYCIVHVARGRSTSVPLNEVLRQARSYDAAGVREMVLTGINIGAYSSEEYELPQLLEHLLQAAPHARFRISSVEPMSISENLIDLLAAGDGRICRHLHLPLQSGSSSVLKEMARPYTAERFVSLVDQLRSKIPELSLSTDIIVGFPGETEEQFKQTLAVAQACAFSKIHVFRYSKRAGTPAAQRNDQVDQVVIADRAHELGRLADKLRYEDAQRRLGSYEDIIALGNNKGLTESHYDVALDDTMDKGTLKKVKLDHLNENGEFCI